MPPAAGDVTVNGRHVHDMGWPLHEVGALLESRSIHPRRSWVRNLLKSRAREAGRSSSPAASWPRWPSPPMRSSSAPAGGLHPGKIRPSAVQAAPAQQHGDKHSFALKSSRHGGP